MIPLRSMLQLFSLDATAVSGLLFWENLLYMAVFISGRFRQKEQGHFSYILWCSLAKLAQAVGWLLLFVQDNIVLALVGDAFLFLGLYWEGRKLLHVTPQNRHIHGAQLGILVMAMIGSSFFQIQGWPQRLPLSFLGMLLLLLQPLGFLGYNALVKRRRGFSKCMSLICLAALLLPCICHFIDRISNDTINTISLSAMLLVTSLSSALLILLPHESACVKTEQLALLDSLTGLPNRHSFTMAVTTSFEWHKREQLPASMLFVDIDYFKKVNDQYGHNFGDEVLVSFARIIERCTRKSDFYCRYGGEEFLIFLSTSSSKQAEHICERLHQEVRAARFIRHPGFRYTISIGVMAGIPAREQTLIEYIENSDRAMYKSKKTGRNKTSVWTGAAPDIRHIEILNKKGRERHEHIPS